MGSTSGAKGRIALGLTERFDDALVWASELHRSQTRKGSDTPYVSHLLAVAGLVIEHGGDEDQAIAALLHDAIEDTDATEADITSRFGQRVAGIVAACSDTDVQPKPPWLARKRDYIAHLETTPGDVLLVSLADKVHNARTIATDHARVGDDYFDVFTGGAMGSRWYYRRLADVYEARADELPSEQVDDRSRPGGRGLLDEYLRALARFGATAEAAEAFDEENSEPAGDVAGS